MVSKEKINEFINRAYKTDCAHGFHDEERSDEHWMMLVISEIGEMVEADRKNKRADVDTFKELEKNRIGSEAEYASYINKCFVEHIKDTLEDELADVCIRLFDYCGTRSLTPLMENDRLMDMEVEFGHLFGKFSVCEHCFALSCMVSDICRYCRSDEGKELQLGLMLSTCFEFARHHKIDLEWHIEHKMAYNESRPNKHDKGY